MRLGLTMRMRTIGPAALAVSAALAAGCGGGVGDLPSDVTGGSASRADSLFTEKNLQPALDRIEKKVGAGAGAVVLKIEPRSIKASVVAGGQMRVVAINKDGNILSIGSGDAPEGTVLPLKDIPAAAPDRIISAIEKKFEVKFEDIDYFAASPPAIPGEKPYWGVYVKDRDGHFQAALDGSDVKEVGKSSGSGSGGSSGSDSASDVADCIEKAGSDPQKITDCTK